MSRVSFTLPKYPKYSSILVAEAIYKLVKKMKPKYIFFYEGEVKLVDENSKDIGIVDVINEIIISADEDYVDVVREVINELSFYDEEIVDEFTTWGE